MSDDDKPADDAKARFREALERKQSKGGGKGSSGGSTQAAGPTAGPAAQQRMFRRKSGG